MKLDTIIAVSNDNKICDFYHKFNDNYWFCQLRDTGSDIYVCFISVKDYDSDVGYKWELIPYYLYGSEFDLKMNHNVNGSMLEHIDKFLNSGDYEVCELNVDVLNELKCTYDRVTNRRLARWLAQGNGELLRDPDLNVITQLPYVPESAYDLVPKEFRVRRWSDDGWYAPTEEYISISGKL